MNDGGSRNTGQDRLVDFGLGRRGTYPYFSAAEDFRGANHCHVLVLAADCSRLISHDKLARFCSSVARLPMTARYLSLSSMADTVPFLPGLKDWVWVANLR